MDGAWLARMRWRWRGALLWPAFVAATIADAFVGHLLPPAGDTQSVVAAALLGFVLNVIALVLLSRPIAAALRIVRAELPVVVARNYAGAVAVALVAGGLLAAGLTHRTSVVGDQRAMQDAIERAQAWIGDRAPAEFARNVGHTDTYAIERGIYRTCVPSGVRPRSYCVIVDTSAPFPRGVRFAGYEPNSEFASGMG